ncbi:MAG: UvrD-helicase domain-containing protein [Bacilli bacterium]|nr:UvrD-helicase domain-containing protein [Bacilli bacterium]
MNLSDEEFQKEKHHLELTTKLLREQISDLAQDLYDSEEKQQEFKKFVWDTRAELDPTEMKTIMSNNDQEIDNLEMKAKYYRKLYQIQNSPYFAKIVFESDEGINDIYIGLTYLTKGTDNIIYDWRAPISSIFYDYEQGNAQYEAPDGIIKGYLHNKRQFTIEDSKIKRVFDSKLNVQDELLQEVLANKTDEYMKNIVNTIQTEQNAIIRNIKDKNLIVQGIAGSGKTSVALHRIAFLLYKIKNLTSDKVLIFAPNKVFSEYISNVLPELGEENTKETTFSDFLETYITEYKSIETFTSFIERYYKYEEGNIDLIKLKQSNEIIPAIDEYIKNYSKKAKFTDEILNRELYIEKDKLNYYLHERYSSIPLFERIDEIAIKISEMEFKGNKSKARQIKKWLRERLNISLDMKEIYKGFYKSEEFNKLYNKSLSDAYIKKLDDKNISFEDACLFVYMKSLLQFLGNDYMIEQTIIDEAQDYNILQYILLKKILKKSKFTILGDINQTINPYYHYKSLEDLKQVFNESVNYIELTKTYRSSPEIIEHANKILGLNLVSAIRRDAKIPVEFREEDNLKEQLLKDIKKLEKDNKSIAIITKTDTEAEKVFKLLRKDLEDLVLIKNNSKTFSRKLVTLPSYMAKGLEFDATIIYTEKDNKYTYDERYLYYVSCTRSQHHLIIYNQEK